MLGFHMPTSLDTGELTEYCGVLAFNGQKVPEHVRGWMLQSIQSNSCFRGGIRPAIYHVYRGTAPKEDVPTCDTPALWPRVPTLQGSALGEGEAGKLGRSVCPDGGAAARGGRFSLWSRSRGPLLGKGVADKEVPSFCSGREWRIKARDLTGQVSCFART